MTKAKTPAEKKRAAADRARKRAQQAEAFARAVEAVRAWLEFRYGERSATRIDRHGQAWIRYLERVRKLPKRKQERPPFQPPRVERAYQAQALPAAREDIPDLAFRAVCGAFIKGDYTAVATRKLVKKEELIAPSVTKLELLKSKGRDTPALMSTVIERCVQAEDIETYALRYESLLWAPGGQALARLVLADLWHWQAADAALAEIQEIPRAWISAKTLIEDADIIALSKNEYDGNPARTGALEAAAEAVAEHARCTVRTVHGYMKQANAARERSRKNKRLLRNRSARTLQNKG